MRRNSVCIFSVLMFSIFALSTIIANSTIGQVYFEDDFSNPDSLEENWEIIGTTAAWNIEDESLVSRGSGYDWNFALVKEELWKGWTEYTYEVRITPELDRECQWIYQIFRYAQPASTDRTNFFAYQMSAAPNTIGLYIDRFLDGNRTRPVPGTLTFGGTWTNDKEHILKLEVTKTSITGYLDGEKQFGPLEEGNLVDGRVGLGVWETDARFDDVKVYGPLGMAVEPDGKMATAWGKIKDEY